MGNLLKIGIIDDFDASRLSRVKTGESLVHTSRELSIDIEAEWLPTAFLGNRTIADCLKTMLSGLDRVTTKTPPPRSLQ
jgi:hypothetical protein